MSFFRQLGAKVKNAFGRQLPHGIQSFGRQLNSFSTKVAGDVDKGQRFLSGLEKKVHDVPVIGGVVHGLASGANALSHVARAGGSAGQALTSLATGDLKGASQAGKSALSNAKSAISSGQDLIATSAPVLATML